MIIIIPGWLITLVTFPGVVMHEIAHRFMCDILQVPVYDVKYFSIESGHAGYVYHHKVNNLIHALLISFAPLFINSLFCMILTLPIISTINITADHNIIFANKFLYWVGISMGMNAFPSNQDIQNVLVITQENNSSFFIRFLCYFMKVLNWIRCAPLDFLYAFLISFIFPHYIFHI